MVEESWLQSEFHICGCFLAGYIHILQLWIQGLVCNSIHFSRPCYNCIEVMRRKSQQVYLWCLFLWTNYKPIDMVTFLYRITHNCNSRGCWSARGTGTVFL